MMWDIEALRDFINMYRARPCLWNAEHDYYLNKNYKLKRYEEIARCLREEHKCRADVTFVKKKIQSLRRVFRKEHFKMKTSRASGKPYKTSLWYYDLMKFTLLSKPARKASKTKTKTVPETKAENVQLHIQPEMEDDTETSAVKVEFNTEQAENPPMIPNFRQFEVDDVEDPILVFPPQHEIENHDNQRTPIDEFDAVGINFAAKLRRMPRMQQIYAESIMHKVVMSGLQNKLTENTSIVELQEA